MPVDQIKAAVKDGERPNLDEIQGPEHLVEFMRKWVEKCWSGLPEERPKFGGEILILTTLFCVCALTSSSSSCICSRILSWCYIACVMIRHLSATVGS